jgi:anti-sigma B factor antagonist
MALRVQTQISGDVFIFLCDGRIVYGDEGAALRERVGNMLRATPKIVIDLNGVDYIDSGGLGILVGLLVSARNRGGELKLVSPRKRVKDVLRRTNLDTIFGVYENNDEAVAAFRKQVAWGNLLGKVEMTQRTFSLVTGVLFFLIALLHAVRLLRGWQVTIEGAVVPIWISWIGLAIASFLAYQGFLLSKTPTK